MMMHVFLKSWINPELCQIIFIKKYCVIQKKSGNDFEPNKQHLLFLMHSLLLTVTWMILSGMLEALS